MDGRKASTFAQSLLNMVLDGAEAHDKAEKLKAPNSQAQFPIGLEEDSRFATITDFLVKQSSSTNELSVCLTEIRTLLSRFATEMVAADILSLRKSKANMAVLIIARELAKIIKSDLPKYKLICTLLFPNVNFDYFHPLDDTEEELLSFFSEMVITNRHVAINARELLQEAAEMKTVRLSYYEGRELIELSKDEVGRVVRYLAPYSEALYDAVCAYVEERDRIKPGTANSQAEYLKQKVSEFQKAVDDNSTVQTFESLGDASKKRLVTTLFKRNNAETLEQKAEYIANNVAKDNQREFISCMMLDAEELKLLLRLLAKEKGWGAIKHLMSLLELKTLQDKADFILTNVAEPKAWWEALIPIMGLDDDLHALATLLSKGQRGWLDVVDSGLLADVSTPEAVAKFMDERVPQSDWDVFLCVVTLNKSERQKIVHLLANTYDWGKLVPLFPHADMMTAKDMSNFMILHVAKESWEAFVQTVYPGPENWSAKYDLVKELITTDDCCAVTPLMREAGIVTQRQVADFIVDNIPLSSRTKFLQKFVDLSVEWETYIGFLMSTVRDAADLLKFKSRYCASLESWHLFLTKLSCDNLYKVVLNIPDVKVHATAQAYLKATAEEQRTHLETLNAEFKKVDDKFKELSGTEMTPEVARLMGRCKLARYYWERAIQPEYLAWGYNYTGFGGFTGHPKATKLEGVKCIQYGIDMDFGPENFVEKAVISYLKFRNSKDEDKAQADLKAQDPDTLDTLDTLKIEHPKLHEQALAIIKAIKSDKIATIINDIIQSLTPTNAPTPINTAAPTNAR